MDATAERPCPRVRRARKWKAERLAERIGIIGGGFSVLLSAYLLERMLGDRAEIVVLEEKEEQAAEKTRKNKETPGNTGNNQENTGITRKNLEKTTTRKHNGKPLKT